MLDSILFYFFAGTAILSAALMVTRRNAIHSAVFLITTLLATAGIFLQLRAEFLFIAQIILYVGGIMVLFVFVIMLLNAGAEGTSLQISNFAKYVGIFLLAAFLGLISFVIQAMLPKTEGVVFGAFQGGTALNVGRKLFTVYLLPFEVTSVLILIAILGAMVLARKEI
jgi:NADH-quinone oxidoreductase subunit J